MTEILLDEELENKVESNVLIDFDRALDSDLTMTQPLDVEHGNGSSVTDQRLLGVKFHHQVSLHWPSLGHYAWGAHIRLPCEAILRQLLCRL